MVKKGYKQTEETKRKIALALKGKHNSLETEFKKGDCRGICPKEIKIKISRSNRKIFNDPIWKETIGVIRNKKISEIQKKQYSEGKRIHPRGMLGKENKWGRHTQKTKKRISNAIKLNPNKYWLNKKRDFETINKIKEKRALQVFPLKDSSIELKIQNFLTQLHIEYLAHKHISEISHAYQCDIFIPVQAGIIQKTIIECDGDYWHGNPNKYQKEKLTERQIKQIENDNIRTKELIKEGFRVIRLWECEINVTDLNKFQKILN